MYIPHLGEFGKESYRCQAVVGTGVETARHAVHRHLQNQRIRSLESIQPSPLHNARITCRFWEIHPVNVLTPMHPRLLALCAAALLLTGCATPPPPPESAKFLQRGEWPESMDSTVKMVLSRLSDKDRDTLKRTPETKLEDLNYTLGMEIRNYYGLWRGNTKLTASACGQPCHPDQASLAILRAAWTQIR